MNNNKDKMILMRYNNYKNISFVDEHLKIIKKYGYTWLLKVGKRIPDNNLNECYMNGGYLILRSPKCDGALFYYARVTDVFNGLSSGEMIFPEYYFEMLSDDDVWMVQELSGSWFKVDEIKPLSNTFINSLVLCRNGRGVIDFLNRSMSSVIYVESVTYDNLEGYIFK